jgi:hypothetical protein
VPSQRNAKATAALERLGRQSVSLQRLDVLTQKGLRLLEAGVSYSAILAKRDEVNAIADEGVRYDFNDALQLVYDETFGAETLKEER